MEDAFGVPVRLTPPLENEIQRRLELEASIEVRGHGGIERIPRVLPVYDRGHSLERSDDTDLTDQAMVKPVRNVLARNPERRAILHEADVPHVRNLRTTDPLTHPSNYIAKNALSVVVQLGLDLLLRERSIAQQGGGQDGAEVGPRTGGERRLDLGDRDSMVVNGVKRCCGGGGDPCRVGTC